MGAIGTHRITLGDTLIPLNSVLRWANGDPVDLSSYTLLFKMELEDGTTELATTSTGVDFHATRSFTAEADDDYLTCNGHGVTSIDQIIVANSGGALPTGLSASTRYWPVNITPNRFQLAASPNGAAINLTTDGSGTNSFYIVGSAQMDFAAANVDPAQLQRGWWVLSSGGETKTIPEGDRWIEILIVAAGN